MIRAYVTAEIFDFDVVDCPKHSAKGNGRGMRDRTFG